MKYLLPTLGLLAAAALAVGACCYRLSGDPALHAAARKGDAMEWLRVDFHLDEQQLATIRRLHENYSATCDEHCRRIQEAGRMKQALLARGASPAERQAADKQFQDLRTACETALAHHVREVAAIMSRQDGQRYLALVMPQITRFDHQAAPDLRFGSTP